MTSPDELQTTLRIALGDIAADWDALMDAMHRSSSAPTIGSPAKDVRLPGGTDRLRLLDQIQRWTTYWTRAVLDEHACATTLLHASDVPATATWLLEHVEWISWQDDAEEAIYGTGASDDDTLGVVELARRLRFLLEPAKVRRPAVGPCPHVIDGHPCHGTVRARFGHEDGDRDLVCDVNGDHAWDVLRWKQLARDIDARVGKDTPPPRMRPDDLAPWLSAHLRTSIQPATIRQWASRNPERIRADEDGAYDRFAVAEWWVERRMTRLGA